MFQASLSAPKIEIVGVYLPKADMPRCEAYIQEWLSTFKDPSNAEEEKELKELEERFGRSLRFSEERLKELEAEFRAYFLDVALIEVLVTNPDERFDVSDFVQPDPALEEGLWQAPWDEVFLSPDGEQMIGKGSREQPESDCFRLTFYIHFWKDELGLSSSYGALACPSPQAVPERLWRLAPYEMPD